VNKAQEFRSAMLGYAALLLADAADSSTARTEGDKAELQRAFARAAHAGHAVVEELHASRN
jgi:hypothetical protein